jgi:hypothetical protein
MPGRCRRSPTKLNCSGTRACARQSTTISRKVAPGSIR